MNRVFEKVRRSVAAAALLALTVGPFAAAPAQADDDSCTVYRSISTWWIDDQGRSIFHWENGDLVSSGEQPVGLGFYVNLSVTNTGAPLSPWKAGWNSPPETYLAPSATYNAVVTDRYAADSGDTVFLVSPVSWNSVLPTGGHVSFGFRGSVPDYTILPSDIVTWFGLSGRVCTVLG